MPDQHLQACIEELKPVLRKYDCVAIVMLQSKTHAEYLIHLEPEWSCVKFVETPDGGRAVHIRAKRTEYPSKEAHHKALTLGIGVLMGFIHVMSHLSEKLGGLVGVISEKAEIVNWMTDENDHAKRFKIE